MANADIQLYNFYKRYLWSATDFLGWQTGMVDHSRGMFEGLLAGAVLEGFDVAPGTGMEIDVSAGIASGATGYLHVIDEPATIEFEAPVGNPVKHLIVSRPLLTPNTYITNPTVPGELVPLRTTQGAEIVLIEGTPAASPEYPETEAGDVVLAGVRLYPSQAAISADDIDFEIRDLIGKNSYFQQDAAKYDNRLRPYQVDSQTIGIKPSQLEAPFARVFSYVNRTRPSIFPKTSGGLYNGAAGDTFLDFQNGEITGADEASSDFTPTIPTAGNSIVAAVCCTVDDTIVVTFGTQGTREECIEGVKNQKAVGSGSVSLQTNTKLLAFVVVSSQDGSNVSELDLFDGRGVAGIGENTSGVAGAGVSTPGGGEYPLTLTNDDDGKVIDVNTSAARTINAADLNSGFKITFKDSLGSANLNPVTFVPFGGQTIEGLASNYVMESAYGSWTFVFDGSNWALIA